MPFQCVNRHRVILPGVVLNTDSINQEDGGIGAPAWSEIASLIQVNQSFDVDSLGLSETRFQNGPQLFDSLFRLEDGGDGACGAEFGHVAKRGVDVVGGECERNIERCTPYSRLERY